MMNKNDHLHFITEDLDFLHQLCAIDSRTMMTENVAQVLKLVEGKLQSLGFEISYVESKIDPTQCFVTSVEIKQTPVLGQICVLAGCLFVERRSRENLTAEVAQVTNALKQEIPVLIFPEGTSTNGEQVIRFRRPLFQAAVDAQVPVVALTLNYQQIDGDYLKKDNRDLVCWYADMSFLPHLWRFFQSQKLMADVQISEVLFEGDLEELQMNSFKAVSKNFRPLL